MADVGYIVDKAEFPALRRKIMERDFSFLNDRQREAVFHSRGPLLILAGAGSGKTTVLVNRAASLIRYGEAYESEEIPSHLTAELRERIRLTASGEHKADDAVRRCLAVDPCPAWRILTITFTNKAAGELRERLSRILGATGDQVVASTFHSFCARILRREGEALGYSSHFTVYDTQDSGRLMKEVLKSLGIEERVLGYKAVLSAIGRAKDGLCSPQEYARQAQGDIRLKSIASAYSLYEKRLQQANAMDFDDLLCKTVELFERFSDILEKVRSRFRYIMVDEYQDTNYAQYRLVSLLSGGNGNLCVVGDDDQSIYKFRGATIENILNFEQEFPSCRVIRLEQNYRSTQTILDAANHVIEKNTGRKGKTLWTDNGVGDKVDWYTLDNEEEEARLIAKTVQNGVAGGRRYRDYAVLYRARAQSNAIERTLMKSAVPYRVVGGHRFYDTQEVRDAMAYLRVIQNPADDVSLRRIVNQPRRAIGELTVDRAAQIADSLGLTMYEVMSDAAAYPALSRAAAKLAPFIRMIDTLREKSENGFCLPHEIYREMLDQSGLLAMWQHAGEEQADRVDNLNELESSLIDYERRCEPELPTLAGFLEEAALMTDADNYDSEADAVALMTVHAAKGLEFPIVFLPGFEDGIFPGRNSMFVPDEMEEERRLCYVGITRAKERLILCCTSSRILYGSTNRNRPSRFLEDIPPKLLKPHDLTFQAKAKPAVHSALAEDIIHRARQDAERRSQGGFPAARSVSPKAETACWHTGDRVRHRVFGTGVIVQTVPMGNDMMLTIRFDAAGQKKVMANYAHLLREREDQA